MNVLEHFRKVSAFIFDVDGVLTDGQVLLVENGLQARSMSIKDGLALQMAVRKGYRVVIVSGGNSEPVRQRMAYLGITEVHLAVKDKSSLIMQYAKQQQLSPEQMLYMGDDLPDLPLLRKVGLAACPADAVGEVKQQCHFISKYPGGRGCVRDVIEKVLKLSNHWQWEEEVISK